MKTKCVQFSSLVVMPDWLLSRHLPYKGNAPTSEDADVALKASWLSSFIRNFHMSANVVFRYSQYRPALPRT